MIEQVRDWLADERYVAIVELAGRKKRVLSWLMALTYDPEPLMSWRAVRAMGLAADRIADRDPEFVRCHLRRLLWLLNDESGSIGWRAPEAIGEILYRRPDTFAEFVPLLLSLLDMEEEDALLFRPGILWAIGRLGQARREAVERAIPRVMACLPAPWPTWRSQDGLTASPGDDPAPQTRGMAVWCLGQLGALRGVPQLDRLLKDESMVEIYAEGQLVRYSVAELARRALQ